MTSPNGLNSYGGKLWVFLQLERAFDSKYIHDKSILIDKPDLLPDKKNATG